MQNTEVTETLHRQTEGDLKDVVFGAQLAMGFVRKAAVEGRVHGKRIYFDSDFIREIHKRVDYGSGRGGQLRKRDNVMLSGEYVDSPLEVPTRFYIFGRWLESQMEQVDQNPDDILLALETAAAAHYGLTRHELHPFPNGNGRTARALVNAILMHSTYELKVHKIAIPPVPLLRTSFDETDEKYIGALKTARRTGELNSLMVFIAQRWVDNLSKLIDKISTTVKTPYKESDRKMIETLNKRMVSLKDFIVTGTKGNGEQNGGRAKNNGGRNYKVYRVPNYFDFQPQHLRH